MNYIFYLTLKLSLNCTKSSISQIFIFAPKFEFRIFKILINSTIIFYNYFENLQILDEVKKDHQGLSLQRYRTARVSIAQIYKHHLQLGLFVQCKKRNRILPDGK